MAKRTRALGTAEAFYVDSHPGKSDAELAAELGLTEPAVRRHRASRPPATAFGGKEGVVTMTAAESAREDGPLPGKEEYLRSMRHAVHVPDPSQPVR